MVEDLGIEREKLKKYIHIFIEENDKKYDSENPYSQQGGKLGRI